MIKYKIIKLRPHHLVCIPRFFSRCGYNKEYENNFKKICFKIKKNQNLKIKIVKGCDDICNKCPYKKENICKKRVGINPLILKQDKRVLNALKIRENSIHKARNILNSSINKIKNRDLNKFCKIKEGCEFLNLCKKYGFNKSFIKDVNKK